MWIASELGRNCSLLTVCGQRREQCRQPIAQFERGIPIMFGHFVLDAATRFEREAPIVSSVQLSELMAYSWPGNVRELHNVAVRFVLSCPALRARSIWRLVVEMAIL